MTLWSTYCTARSTCTRSTSSCSNCMHAIVPVASWRSVWSTLSEIGSPGFRSPSTRCSSRILRGRLGGIGRESYSVKPASGSASAQVLAGHDLRHHLVDPVDAHGVVLAGHVAARARRVHAHELAVLVHERAAGVAGVDHGIGEDHVLVGAERLAALVDRVEGGLDGGDVTARGRQLRTREARGERALGRVVSAWVAHSHHVIADLQVLLSPARQVREAGCVAHLYDADVLAVRRAEDLRGLAVRAGPECVAGLLDLQVVALSDRDVLVLRHDVRVRDDDPLARVPDPTGAAAHASAAVVVHDEPGRGPHLVDDLRAAEA